MVLAKFFVFAFLPALGVSQKQCHAISPSATDGWCNSNCNHNPPNCPASLCNCDGPGPSPPSPSPPAPTPPAPTPPAPTPPAPAPAGGCHQKDGSFDGPACGYACDDNCNCGRCNSKPGCMTNDTCLGTCNSGHNAKWCPGGPAPTPPSPSPPTPTPPAPAPAGGCHQKDGAFDGPACGYACDDNCNCGHCNSKPGCMSNDTCLGNCNSGHNAKWCPGGPAPTPPSPSPPTPTPPAPAPAGGCHQKDGSFDGPACGYACDDNCNCGRCNSKPGCMSNDTCLGACNGGHNAKWCPGGPAPAPPSPSPPAPPSPKPPSPPPAPPTPGYPGHCHARDGSFDGPGCGYACDDNCNCGRCNTKPGCMSEGQCLGTCNAGKNAKWCGAAPTPPPPAPPAPPPSPPVKWSTSGNKLQRNGKDVVLHGFGTTCTEYLTRGIGMKCWVNYDFSKPDALMTLNVAQLYPLIDYLRVIASDSTMPVVRIPMTASSWLGIQTNASKGNMAKYPKLNVQYQNLIADFVTQYSKYGIVTILDLHWSDDDTDNAPFADKNCAQFWDSVAAKFGNNPLVFYELYNEPHRVTEAVWANGDDTHSGMLEMLAAVRKHTDSPVIMAGYGGYAYDSDSLVKLDATLLKQGEKNVIWNLHPYMGPNQAGDSKKCPDNFESYVMKLITGTDKPVIVTEFGQRCQPTTGAAESCPGTYEGKAMGYDEAIMTISQKHGVSWLPWAWRPMAGGPNTKTCQDINGGTDPAGLSLAHPTDGKGADFLDLWKRFAGAQGHWEVLI